MLFSKTFKHILALYTLYLRRYGSPKSPYLCSKNGLTPILEKKLPHLLVSIPTTQIVTTHIENKVPV